MRSRRWPVEGDLQLPVEEDFAVSDRLAKVLREAAQEEYAKVYPEGDSLAERYPRLPRWPSGLGPSFDRPYGGFQGVTVFGGFAGVGKSTLAMACALENARAGALVVYFDAENAQGEQQERAINWHGKQRDFDEAQQYLALNFRLAPIDNRHCWQTMLPYVAKQILHRHQRVLIVMDSMQSIARETDPKRNMLVVTSELYSSMNRIVRASAGRIGFLVLSELNKEGGDKGGSGKYSGTMVLRITREERPEPKSTPDYMIEMLKNRNGPTPGEIGLHTLEWWRCRFEPVKVS